MEQRISGGMIERLDAYREKLREVYCEIPVKGIYYNSRSSMDFSFEASDNKLHRVNLDPMVSSVIVSSVVPKSCVLYKGGHGGGKTSMIEETSSSIFAVPKKDIVEAMIRGNDDQNVNTLLASYNIGKLLTKGDEEVRWRKFVTCPVKIIDELNRFPPTAQNALFEILNKGRVEFGGGHIYEVDDFEVFATENPNDVGTYPMSRPFLDRFGLCIPAPQLPSAEDLMALSSRRDDKLYAFEASKRNIDIKEAKELEKLVNDTVRISNDGLLYMIYFAQALATCSRGDFSDKSHSCLAVGERCKGCEYDTKETLCQYSQDGFSGRAFLDLQRWSKGYAFFLDAFKDKANPEVQQGIVEAIAPYVLYHRVEPNEAIFTKEPFFGRKLEYLKTMAEKARKSYATVRAPLLEIPDILSGKLAPEKAKIYEVKKDLVVKEHFLPIVEAAKLEEFRALYKGLDEALELTEQEIIDLEKTMTFNTSIPARAKAFLRAKALTKLKGGESQGAQTL